MVRMKGSKDLQWYPMLLSICIQEIQLEKFLLLCDSMYPDYWNKLNISFSSIFSISKTFGYLTPHLLKGGLIQAQGKIILPCSLILCSRVEILFFLCFVLCSAEQNSTVLKYVFCVLSSMLRIDLSFFKTSLFKTRILFLHVVQPSYERDLKMNLRSLGLY